MLCLARCIRGAAWLVYRCDRPAINRQTPPSGSAPGRQAPRSFNRAFIWFETAASRVLAGGENLARRERKNCCVMCVVKANESRDKCSFACFECEMKMEVMGFKMAMKCVL